MTSHSDTRTLPIFPPTSPRSSLGRILGARWGSNLPPVALYVGTSTSIPPLLPALLLLAVIVSKVRGGIVCAVFVIIVPRDTTVNDFNDVDDPPPLSSSSSSSYPPPSRTHEVDIVAPIVGVRVVLVLVVIVVIVALSRSQMRSSRVVICARGIFVVIASHVESVSAELRCSQRSFAVAWRLGLRRRRFVSVRRFAAGGRRRRGPTNRGVKMGLW